MIAAADYFSSIWSKRYFWMSLVKVDLRRRYRRSWLGIGWSLMNPIAMTTVFCVVFSQLFHEDVVTYAPYVLSGLAFWSFVTGCTSDGCQCFFQSEIYIRQHPAPLAIYPLRVTLGMALHFAIGLLVLLAMVVCLRGPQHLLHLWSVVPALALLFVLAWSVAVCMGVVNVIFPDMQHLVQVGLQMAFYLTPVFYSPGLLNDHGMNWLIKWNPLAAALELIRAPILDCRLATLHAWLLTGATTCVLVALAGWILSRVERRLIFFL